MAVPFEIKNIASKDNPCDRPRLFLLYGIPAAIAEKRDKGIEPFALQKRKILLVDDNIAVFYETHNLCRARSEPVYHELLPVAIAEGFYLAQGVVVKIRHCLPNPCPVINEIGNGIFFPVLKEFL